MEELECWNDGILGKFKRHFLIFHYSSLPLLRIFSSIPIFHHFCGAGGLVARIF